MRGLSFAARVHQDFDLADLLERERVESVAQRDFRRATRTKDQIQQARAVGLAASHDLSAILVRPCPGEGDESHDHGLERSVGGRLKTRNFGREAGQRFFGFGGGSFDFARERSSA